MIPPLLVDENVGRRLKEALLRHGFDLRTHEDIGLPRGTNDQTWIEAAGSHSWAALSTDIKQSRRTNEWRAIQSGRVKHVVVHAKKMTGAIAAEIVEQHVIALKIVLGHLPPPFTLRLLKDNVQLRSYHVESDTE